jgi:hypothetical protein
MEPGTTQKGSLSIAPSQYGFALIWSLEGAEPAELLHRQARPDALEMMRRQAAFLVRAHGWEVVREDEDATHLTRRWAP